MWGTKVTMIHMMNLLNRTIVTMMIRRSTMAMASNIVMISQFIVIMRSTITIISIVMIRSIVTMIRSGLC